MEKKTAQLSRRSFLATSAALAGMSVAAATGCKSTAPVEPEPVPAPEETSYIATCRGNCGGGCALVGKVREGKIVSTFAMEIPGNPEGVEHGCVKGQSNALRLYGAHRLRYPMKRAGEKGSGNWEKISWDEAIKLIADKFNAAIAEYGAGSILFQHSAGNPYGVLDGQQFCIANFAGWNPAVTGVAMNRFIQKFGVTVMSCGYDQAGMYNAYYVVAPASVTAEDFVNSKCLVFWGCNPADATFSRSNWYWTCKARENGAKIIVVDPLFTATAAQADMWLPVVPGTDSMLMCMASKYLIENGKADIEAMKKTSVAPLLIDVETGAYVRLSTLGKDPLKGEKGDVDDVVVYDAEAKGFVAQSQATAPVIEGSFKVAGKTVIPVFAAMMENLKDLTLEATAHETTLSEQQIIDFANMMADNTPTNLQLGYGVEHAYGSWRFGFASALLASVLGGVGKPGTGYWLASGATSAFKAPVNKDASCIPVEGAIKPFVFTGDYLPEIMETGNFKGREMAVRCIYNHGADPLDNCSDPNGMIEAYKKVDFVVTAEQYMTTTCHYSDLVLPVAMAWEAEDFRTSGNFMSQKAIEPIGEARPDFDIIKDVATAMGYPDLLPGSREDYLRAVLDTEENKANGTAYDDYHEHGVILKDEVPVVSAPAKERNALGRTQFYVERMMPRDYWGQTIGMTDRLPNYEHCKEAWVDNPDRAQYPLFGFSSHNVYHGQSDFAHNAWLDNFRTVKGRPFCIISEEAAAARGIKTGDKVRATSAHGFVVLQAVVTPGIQKDCVWFPHGFWWDEFEAGTAQSLTGPNIDPYVSNTNYNDFICEVTKA